MAGTLVHRGPDEYGERIVPELGGGLASRRLPEKGSEPISQMRG